jgi:hypothetical protein
MDLKTQLINEITKHSPEIINNINKLILIPIFKNIWPYIVVFFSLIIILIILLIYIVISQYKLSKYIYP